MGEQDVAHGALGYKLDPSWLISHSSLCFMTGVTKAMIRAILSVGWCAYIYIYIKEPLLPTKKSIGNSGYHI